MTVSSNRTNSQSSSGWGAWKFWQRSSTPAPTDSAPPVLGAPHAITGHAGVTGSIQQLAAHDGTLTTRVEFRIEHWLKGRLRITIPRLATDSAYGERLSYRIMASTSAFRVRVNPKASSLVIMYDPGAGAASDVLAQVSICIQEASSADAAIVPARETEPTDAAKKPEIEQINYVKRLGLPALGLGMSVGAVAGLPFPPLAIAATIMVAAAPSFWRAWLGIRDEKKLNVDFLDSLAITALTASGVYFAPAFMVSLIESGEIIRDMTARGTARANLDLLDTLGKTAMVERDGVDVEVPLTDVQPGDIVVVYPGDQIPVDGTVIKGVGLVDQQKLTGESVPITRESGEDVFAATLVIDGSLRIETKRTGNNTRAGVVVALMNAAPIHDTRMENYARKIGDRLVIPTLALGGAATLMTGSIPRGVGVITLDVGTGVRVSVPTAILSSVTYAARQGILIRSGRAIEQLAQVDTVVFDKTGTLTQGRAGVVGICTAHDAIDPSEVLRLAATAEQGLTHPVAEAIIRHARESGLTIGECEEWEFRVGQGIVTRIEGRDLMVGSHRMMGIEGIDTDTILRRHPEIETSAASQVFVTEGKQLLGVILYKDPARIESPYVIEMLKEMGITAYMLSGDVQKVARAVGAELGMDPDNVYAEAFPERKVEVVKGLQENGKAIAFVGDGINDSAALAHASVSVSFASATDMARETADIVLMDDDLSSLILAIKICKNAMKTVYQNVGIVLGPNLTAMAFAVTFGLSPIAAVVVNNGSAIVAEMNGFRPMMGPPGRKQLMNRQSLLASGQKRATPVRALLTTTQNEIGEPAAPAVAANGAHGTNGTHGAHGQNGVKHTNGQTTADEAHMAAQQPIAVGMNGVAT